MEKYKGIIYAIASSVAFGLMPIFAKYAYANGSNSTTVLIARYFLAAFILFVYLKCKNISTKITKRQKAILFASGTLAYPLTTQTLFVAYEYLGAGLATTFHFIYPAIVCIIAYILFKEKMSKQKIISLIIAGLGVYSLVALEDNKLNTMGIILALFSGVVYAINIVVLGLKELRDIDNKVVTMYTCTGAFIGMLLFGIIDQSIIFQFNSQIIFSYIGITLVSTITSIILFLKAIETIGPTSTSILGTFEPIVSIVLGVLFFGESISVAMIIGTILILISTIILAKEKG